MVSFEWRAAQFFWFFFVNFFSFLYFTYYGMMTAAAFYTLFNLFSVSYTLLPSSVSVIFLMLRY
ncbi:hypothetical protein F8388_006829 [Cannabis sativa]|uniref:Uncharacterized protein n=1 Tax=Cannabis sativa TaxID=3483 RepID=A0A7J6GVB5_CANSA|nr:hypothetical protein F8388_006829 [Cannabis sativa]